jgi:type II secretion system protein D
VWHAEFLSAETKLFGKKAGKPVATPSSGAEQVVADPQLSNGTLPVADSRPVNANDKQIKLNYFSKTWGDVLRDVAQQGGRQLIIDKVPPGRFSRNDWSRYTLSDAVKILNRELEPKGFRILERGPYLDLVFLRDARSEYARPVVSSAASAVNEFEANSVNDLAQRKLPSKNTAATTQTAADSRPEGAAKSTASANRPKRNSMILQVAHDEMDEDDGTEENLDLAETPRRWVAVTLKHQTARNISRALYQAFEQDAELIDQGPNGLPGFVVWRDVPSANRGPAASRVSKAAPQRLARFAIGVDTKGDRLLIDGPPTEITTVKSLVQKLDVVSNSGDSSVRLVSTKRDPRQVTKTLNSAIKQLAQARASEAASDAEVVAQAEIPTKPKAKKNAKKKADSKPAVPVNPADPKSPSDDGEMEAPENKAGTPTITGPLKGDVNIEELGDVLIIKGNEQDVQMVEKLIAEISKMLSGSVPDVNVRPLEHVDSESLADLLSTVYERLNRSRGRSSTDQTQQIVVIAIGKPNAVMVLASERDMPTVDMLIKKLDQPVDPSNEFEVFRLRYAVASQMLTAVDSFFGGGTTGGAGGQVTTPGTTRSTTGGLRGRVKAIADSRTNSLIVQARPRDLEEVRRLVDELDQVGSQAVNQIKLIPLKNAVADEMAELLNLAIQSVISPPQQARTQQGGGGNAFGGGGAQGQVDQKLREAKSAVLQLLDNDDGDEMVQSGVLADIRINADSHTNSLVVTAPEESLAMIQALVRKFDKPSGMVAEIKHFTLQNADASSVVTMLNQLFNNQQASQGQRGGGNQNQQLGIQLSGAEDASSQLIPLKFSTDVRTNSIIAVGGSEALGVVEAIIFRLDASEARQRKSLVYQLKNSPAQEVANALTLFLQGQRDLVNQGNQNLVSDVEQLERQIIVIAEPNSNSLLISATPRYFKDITEMVTRIDSAKPEVVIQALLVEVVLENTDEFGVELGFQDSILFDRSNISSVTNVTQNSIFNTTSQTSAVNQSGQTTTTTTITPQSLQTSTPFSVGLPGYLFNNQPLGNNFSAPNSSKVGSQGLSNFSVGRTNGNLGFGGLVLSAGSESVNVLLRALSASRRLEILSRPQIRTLDSQTGSINVGQLVPVVTQINNATGTPGLGGGGATPIVQQQPAGIILEVTPRITPDDRIVMQVHAERSAFNLLPGAGVILSTDTNGRTITAPVKDISTALTTVSVSNEQTIVLGGLIQKTDETIARKVPWLGDIPILGNAFRFDSHNQKRTELLIFLTPRIVKNDSVSETIKQIEAERLHFTECEAEALHGPLFGIPTPVEGATPPVYTPGEMWSPRNNVPLPPEPIEGSASQKDSNVAPRILPVPPMSAQASAKVQGAAYQPGERQHATSDSAPRGGSNRAVKTVKKSTILDTFRREPIAN